MYSINEGKGGIDDIDFKITKARYVKILGRQRGSYWGYSLFEVALKTPEDPGGEGESSDFVIKKQWDFKIDPKNIGEKNKWYSLDFNSKNWSKIKTGAEWEKQGHQAYDGYAWYRSNFFIPKSWKNDDLILLLNDIRSEYKLYINGKLVTRIEHGKDKNILKIKKHIKFNSQNLVVLRVNNPSGVGGIKGAIALIKNEQALENKIQSLQQGQFKDYYDFLAQIEPDGYFPYWLKKDQGFWTVVGMYEDYKESLFYEDGTIEPYKSFSISPFLYINDQLITRGNVKLSQSLEKDYLPIPSVTWEYPGVTMEIKVFPYGNTGEAVTYAWYKIKNNTSKTINGKLFLAFRPFEINPPWQWGGYNKIKNVKYKDDYIQIEKYKIVPLTEVSDFGVSSYKDGDIIYYLEKGKVPDKTNLNDRDGLASGALEFQYELAPGKEKDIFIAIPLYKNAPVNNPGTKSSIIKSTFNKMIKENIDFWEAKLNNVKIDIPDSDIVKTIKSNLAYIFINQDGPAIQPGSRAYEAAWIRDGAMTSAALLRMGYYKEVKEYIDWYSKFLYEDGRVPAIIIIGRNEINPVKEFDSQGELIYLMLQYYYFTKDKDFLKEKWPIILKTLKHLEFLRNKRISGKYEKYKHGSIEKRKFFGILPNSVSHEGYYPEPGNHSYWDDFWALKGWKDAAIIAKIIGKQKYLDWIKTEEQELRVAVYESIKLSMQDKGINYIPGCAELGDFDPTSTAIAIMVCDELDNLPQPQLNNTFNKYYQDLLKRLEKDYVGSFTPYEIRSVQAFLYMNQKERALTLLNYLLGCRRPIKWKQWPEALYFPYREGGYIGDMPHTWVGSGYINSVRSMFVYEQDNNKLILGAGIVEDWFNSQEEISITDFPTQFGDISYTIKKEKNLLKVKIFGLANPDKGLVFKSPFLKKKINKVKINDKKWKNFTDTDVIFDKLPVEIVIEYY